MAWTAPEIREIEVSNIGEQGITSNDNVYLECDSDLGVIAFWGRGANPLNIKTIKQLSIPAKIKVGLIGSKWPQHQYWVPEGQRIYKVEGPTVYARSAVQTVPKSPTAGATGNELTKRDLIDELNRIRSKILQLLTRIIGPPDPNDGVISRITCAKRMGRIPRTTAALMIALTEFRNVVEYSKGITEVEYQVVNYAWQAVSEWASTKGVDVNSL